MTIRVYEFSKKHKLTNKDVLSLLDKGGFSVKSHMSTISEKALKYLEDALKEKETPSKKPEKQASPKKAETVPSKEPIKEQKKVMQTQPAKSRLTRRPAPVKRPISKPLRSIQEPIKEKPTTIVARAMTVDEVAEKLGEPVNDVILQLLRSGVVAAKNQVIKPEIVEQIARFFQVTPVKEEKKEAQKLEKKEIQAEGELKERLPIVVVMGHVDHGKTTLLDYVRKARVAAREAGGITQHLGAYEVPTSQGSVIFLDTPGHEAFSKIRQRGAHIADIAVLVIAADDGIMPQTKEAIKHARDMGLPIIVAINKIDKADPARIEVVKRQLSEQDLLPEEWGGQTIVSPISALTGAGVEELLELLALQSQIMELRASSEGMAKGYVLESKLEKGRGAVATLILQHGTLRIGDYFKCGDSCGRITSIVNSAGKRLAQCGPSTPVQIAGFEVMPQAGDFFEAATKSEYLNYRSKLRERSKKSTSRALKEGAINLIIKADTHSSKEALADSIARLSGKSEIGFNIISAGIGDINESDVELAFNTGSRIVTLHSKAETNALELAQRRKVPLLLHDIIYKLLEELEKFAESQKEVELERKKIGEAVVRKVFDIKGIGIVAGSYVNDGRFVRNGYVIAYRDGKKIGEGNITSLQRERKTVKEVHTGFECGFVVEGMTEWQEDDTAECYIEVPKQ